MVIDNCNDNQKFSSKQQERINQISKGKSAYGANTYEIKQGKAYQRHLENTENKADSVDQFTKHIQKINVC